MSVSHKIYRTTNTLLLLVKEVKGESYKWIGECIVEIITDPAIEMHLRIDKTIVPAETQKVD
ncbi:MAG TPA: hypothetical protein DEP17_09705, partial [Lachnospiraceae bacterium]|nr:hypothetical protein [Lachnospiraceae bacterium]